MNPRPGSPPRRGYIDWLRGVAVLIMIEAHTIDAWTRAADREGLAFGLGAIVGGFGAPVFLFLAGVAVPLAASARMRRGASLAEAARALRRRGWQIFGLALLFRLQARLLGGGSWRSLLKVDILNIMGPALVLTAAVYGACRTMRTRFVALGALVVFTALATPLVRSAAWPAVLPDFLEGYLRPVPQLTNFTLFPWAGFVCAGAIAGAVLVSVADARGERRANTWFAVAGAALILVGWAGSRLPSPYPQSSFWTSSPAFFAIRLGILTMALPLAFLWGLRPGADRWSPLRQFGRTSLFVYWIHVEMVYGTLSTPWHRALSLWQWVLAYAMFTALLVALSVAKSWMFDRRRPSRPQPVVAGGYG